MANIIWITPAGDLGITTEQEYYEKQFDAYNNAGGAVSFLLIAGALPGGLSISSTGLLSGIPDAVTVTTEYSFVVRATNGVIVADRTFTITISNSSIASELKPESGSLGNYYITDYVDIQFYIEPTNPDNAGFSTVYTLQSGTLPLGLTLTSSGQLHGYLLAPASSFDDPYAPGFDAAAIPSLGLYANAFDITGFDYSGAYSDITYQFSIQSYDGSTVDVNTYTMYVQSSDQYNPVLFNVEGSIGNIRQNTNFAYKFDAVDYNYADITYALVSVPGEDGLPDGLTLNPNTGWVTGYISNTAVGTGHITANIESNIVTGTSTLFLAELSVDDIIFVSNSAIGTVSDIVNNTKLILSNVSTANVSSASYAYTVGLKTRVYDFSVFVYETYTPTSNSNVKHYSVTVKGDIPDTVIWTTDSNIGNIYNGEISTLSIEAYTPSGLDLTYHLVEGSYGALPIGLVLLPDGNLSGRISFQLDLAEQTYTFTVAAYDSNLFAYAEKTFTITVIKRDEAPYENLYLQILPEREQRDLYDSIINNTSVFPDDYIYRANDPWFGKNTLRRVLFLTGLNSDELSNYIEAMTYNHYWKNINFGNIKSARAVDSNLDPLYDVVYVELVDTEVNSSGDGPPLSVYMPDSVRVTAANVVIDGVTIYPNSFPNMAERIGDGVGYENRSVLPAWMTTRQENGQVLGFTRALILAYVKPGRGNECAYRLNQLQPDFNLIDFTLDRYELDDSLSDYWVVTPVEGTGNIMVSTNNTLLLGTGQAVQLDIDSMILPIDQLDPTADLTKFYFGSNSSFTTELVPNTQIYVGNTLVGKVDSINDDHSLNLVANGAAVFYNEGFKYNNQYSNNLTVATGTISANTSSNIVVGSSTTFATEIHNGDIIYVNDSAIGTVNSVTSNTEIVLTSVSTANVSGVHYTHTFRDPYTVPGQGDKYLKFPQVGVLP